MKTLRNFLAVAVLSLPLVTLNAGALIADAQPADVASTPSLTEWCYVYMNGQWYQVPC